MGGTPSRQVCKQSCISHISKQYGGCISSRSRSCFTTCSCSTASLSGLTFQTLSPRRQQRYRQDRFRGYCTHLQNVHAGHPPGLSGDQSRTAHRHHPALRRTLPQHKQRGRRPGRTGHHTTTIVLRACWGWAPNAGLHGRAHRLSVDVRSVTACLLVSHCQTFICGLHWHAHGYC